MNPTADIKKGVLIVNPVVGVIMTFPPEGGKFNVIVVDVYNGIK
jgi:hypothetical protein